MRYYSKRELYALGETLGDSVTEHKVGGGRVYGGGGKGGGGGGGQTTSTSNVSNIPAYAQPYVETMLGATQKQLFTMDDTGGITGFQPYKAYGGTYDAQGNQTSYDPSKAIAGFSPAQQQAQAGIMGMQVPQQYGQAMDATTAAGMGAFGTVGQAGMYGQQGSALSNMYGNAGAQAGQQAAGQSGMYGMAGYGQGQQGAAIGQSLGQQSQNTSQGPGSVASYMNPYLQNSLNPAMQLANQQYGIAGQQQQGAATSAGAFGGSRSALANSLNQQNQMLAQNQIIGQGYNQAYNNAQNQMNTANQAALAGNAQAQQGISQGLQGAGQAGSQAMQGYGMGLQGAQQAANIGLQGVGAQQAGYSLAGQQASNLANMGQQQLAAQQGIYNAQNQVGTAQQAQQQQIINQSMTDYANAQQYPLMQLGTMSNMLRGLPMQASTTNQYVAAPNAITQGIGLAGAGASIINATKGNAAGGAIKEKKMASGGITGIASFSAGDEVKSDLYNMPVEALQKELQTTTSDTIKNEIKMILAQRQMAGVQHAAKGGIMSFSDGNKGEAVSTNPSNTDKFFTNLEAEKEATRVPYREMIANENERLLGRAPAPAANPEMVRQGYIDAAKAQAANQPAASPVVTKPAGNGIMPLQANGSDVPMVIGSKELTNAQASAPAAAVPGANVPVQSKPAIVPPTEAAPVQTPNIIVPPVAAPAAKAPGTGIMSVGPEPTPPSEKDLPTIESLMAERQRLLGPNTGNQEQRANLMAEKANAKDEARRQTSLRMAEFFGAWGSTPGNSIVAGLNALKNKIPDFITDMKDQNKIRRDIDKDIAALDKIDRDEKAGLITDAAKERNDIGKRSEDKYGRQVVLWASKNTAAAHVQAAGITASAKGANAGEGNYFKALKNEGEVAKAIAKEKETTEYKMNAGLAQYGTGKQKEDAATWIASKNAEHAAKIKNAKSITEQHNKLGRAEAGVEDTGEPSAAPPMIAVNPNTKERIMSTDGGKTWQPAGAK